MNLARPPFRNDLLARDLLPNQLRYKQLRPHRPVKRVEMETVITHVAIGRAQPGQNTCPPAPDGSPTGKHVTPGPQSPASGTGRSDTCVDRWRGQVQNFDLNGRSDAGHILQPQKTGMSWTAFPRTPANTKKSLRTISRLKTPSKHGGFLRSHLVWQYHRR